MACVYSSHSTSKILDHRISRKKAQIQAEENLEDKDKGSGNSE